MNIYHNLVLFSFKCSPVHTTKSLKIPKGNSKLYIKEGQTIQWPKEKGQIMIYKTLQRKQRTSNTNSTINRGWTQVLRKDFTIWYLFLYFICHLHKSSILTYKNIYQAIYIYVPHSSKSIPSQHSWFLSWKKSQILDIHRWLHWGI
jgi:hypothetical protein